MDMLVDLIEDSALSDVDSFTVGINVAAFAALRLRMCSGCFSGAMRAGLQKLADEHNQKLRDECAACGDPIVVETVR
jgi:hypothetical protein